MKNLNSFLEGNNSALKPIQYFDNNIATDHASSGAINIKCGDMIDPKIRMLVVGMMSSYAEHLLTIMNSIPRNDPDQ